MARDSRGNPGRYVPKNQPRLTLANVIRRRRTNLKAFVTDLGVSTYAGLTHWCDRMGILPPEQAEFEALFPPRKVNSPMEGVVVLEAPPVIDEISGRTIDPEAPVQAPGVEVVTDGAADEAPEAAQKKRRQKKESQPTEA